MGDIWKHPSVVQALKDGRDPSDIMILDCPNCGAANYYNEGTSYHCANCDSGYYVAAQDEEVDCACVYVEDAYTLQDTCGVPEEGAI